MGNAHAETTTTTSLVVLLRFPSVGARVVPVKDVISAVKLAVEEQALIANHVTILILYRGVHVQSQQVNN